ncbi:hypothetical protein [Butyrivibrio sp. XPD2006]|uniref:hypothetical protein n=1 Tax=Butyrivibrio sp. XPD2006 TaxID=1280668 RepID=UPI0003B3A383|nr:hypothetical protein [Butyrivibrio sp. XPD2006]
MASKRLRKVMHKSLAVATSAILVATASVGAGFTAFAEDEFEDVSGPVISDPDAEEPEYQGPKEVGSITSYCDGIIVDNGGEVTAHGNVTVDSGVGIQNSGGTVLVEGNVDSASAGSSGTNGIFVNGEGTTKVDGNVAGNENGIHVVTEEAETATVTVTGDVTGSDYNGIQIGRDYNDIDGSNATVTVIGNVTGNVDGIHITSGGEVTVTGDVKALKDDGIQIGHAGGYSDGISGNVTVNGNVTSGSYGLYIDKGIVDVSGDITGEWYGVSADDKSNIKVGGNVTSKEYGIDSSNSTISVEGSVTSKEISIESTKSTISVGESVNSTIGNGIYSRGSEITVGKDVEANISGIGAFSKKDYSFEFLEGFEEWAHISSNSDFVTARPISEILKPEVIPSKVYVGGNVTAGLNGVTLDQSSTVHVKGDVTASGEIKEDEQEDREAIEFEIEFPDEIEPKYPIAAITIEVENEDFSERFESRRLAFAIPDDDADPDAGEEPKEENPKSESVKGIVIVEGTVKVGDYENGAYGVLLGNRGYETAAEIIAATPDIVVYEFDLGNSGELVGYEHYKTPSEAEIRPMALSLAATDGEITTGVTPIDDEYSEEIEELEAEVIDTVKGLINYIIKHDDEVSLDSLNDGEEVRKYEGLETMRIGEVLSIKFQEGYELENEDYLKTIATVEKISDGVYKITLNSELGGINIKALKKAIEDDIIEDPIDDPVDDPDDPQEDPIDQPQDEPNNEPTVVIIEESQPAPAPVSNPEPVLVPLVAGATAPAPAPAPAPEGAAVLGARRGSTEDTANSPIRVMIILFASLGALVVCGTKYFVKEK